MRSFGIAAAACALALCVATPAAVLAQQSAGDGTEPLQQVDAPDLQQSAARKPAPRYFIEFRSRSALSYGHSFVVFGRIGEKITARNVAGLHPRGDSSITYIIGHVLPVPSETGASDGDLDEQYMTARYRIMLTPREYRAIVAQIRELQANSPVWNAATFNCNAFVGTIARFAGLTAPPPWLLPEDFINSMRWMNGDRQHANLQPVGLRSTDGRAAMARHTAPKR